MNVEKVLGNRHHSRDLYFLKLTNGEDYFLVLLEVQEVDIGWRKEFLKDYLEIHFSCFFIKSWEIVQKLTKIWHEGHRKSVIF